MRSRKKAFYKKGTFIAAVALCLVSAFGLAGIYRMESSKNKQDQELVNWEELDADSSKRETSLQSSTEKSNLELVDKDEEDGQQSRLDIQAATNEPVVEPTQEPLPDMTQMQAEAEPTSDEEVGDAAAQASVQSAVNLNFKAEDGMIWPVEGNVILDYSMEQSIYFPTLEQYKYNPAIAIQSERGTPVLSVAAGVVESIVETDETGITMTVDLGNGYQAVYGQLADVSLSTGSYVEAGSQIGVVAEPSIYYRVEGDNLYFQVLKDEVPQDPLDFIR